MDDDLARALRMVAVQLVVATAAIHLAYALPRLRLYSPAAMQNYARVGIVPPPRPALFLLLGLLLVGGVVAVWRGVLDLRVAYVGGIALLGLSVIAWVVWHTALDHGAVLTAAAGPTAPAGGGGDGHGVGVVHTVVDHFFEPLLAVVSQSASSEPGSFKSLLAVVAKVVELGTIALLAVLLRTDPALETRS